jgi:hypothetical protein
MIKRNQHQDYRKTHVKHRAIILLYRVSELYRIGLPPLLGRSPLGFGEAQP